MICHKCAEKLRDQRHIQHWNDPEAQCATQVSGPTVQLLEKILQLMKDGPGVLLKNQTSWSEQDPFPATLKQRDAKTDLQIPHLLRNTGLRNSEPVSRTAKASRLSDREKIPEMTNVQRVRHGKRILFGRIAKCNQELEPRTVRG